MKIRSIYPSACRSRTLAQISDMAERLFWRLLTYCDDDGRGLNDELVIKGECFPVNLEICHERISGALKELENVGLIVVYESNKKTYLSVVNFKEFQHPKRYTPSRLPAPPAQTPPEPLPEALTEAPTEGTRGEHEGNMQGTRNPLEKGVGSRELGVGNREQGGGSREQGDAREARSAEPAACPPWLWKDLLGIVTERQGRRLLEQLGVQGLQMALLKLGSRHVDKPAGLLVRRADELAQEGLALVNGALEADLKHAPGAFRDARWMNLRDELREDLEIMAAWVRWRALEAGSGLAQGDDSDAASKTALKAFLALCEARHPEPETLRADLAERIGPTPTDQTPRFVRQAALMGALLGGPVLKPVKEM